MRSLVQAAAPTTTLPTPPARGGLPCTQIPG